jgi:hypothetical protein
MTQIYQKLKAKTLPYFLVKIEAGGGAAIAPVEEYGRFFDGVPVESVRRHSHSSSSNLTHLRSG